ncbi:MAG: hypothetical protein HDT43_00840 [Ruminococcaceae bacterium]|nr:hypothetical protein [Oscillospiraceae bacterium]
MADTEFVKKADVIAILVECQRKIDDDHDYDLKYSPESMEGANDTAAYILNCVNALPAADARAVVYGHWIPLYDDDSDKRRGVAMNYECSECSRKVSDATYSRGLDYELCPHCGAVMDGKENQREETE